jgi:hypothetical protein
MLYENLICLAPPYAPHPQERKYFFKQSFIYFLKICGLIGAVSTISHLPGRTEEKPETPQAVYLVSRLGF